MKTKKNRTVYTKAVYKAKRELKEVYKNVYIPDYKLYAKFEDNLKYVLNGVKMTSQCYYDIMNKKPNAISWYEVQLKIRRGLK